MKLVLKIVFYFACLVALGFCVAFVFDELRQRVAQDVRGPLVLQRGESVSPAMEAERAAALPLRGGDAGWRERLGEAALAEISFTDGLLERSEREGELTLEIALSGLEVAELEDQFVELMARDLEDYRALQFAGRVLQEIAERDPTLAVSLLGAMRPAERETLAAAVAKGWTAVDPRGAFNWIQDAWIAPDGAYIDRETQNQLYIHAMDTLVGELKDYQLAADTLEGIVDPDLRVELIDLVAHQIVRDGPEAAFERLAGVDSSVFDLSILDAVAEQWAARDSLGAADWALANEVEISQTGVRSIARHLSLETREEALRGFHSDLETEQNRDAVAAEVARLRARRDPEGSASWARAIERPQAKQAAVLDALYEIGYESFGRSVGYIDAVYELGEEARSPVVFATLRNWLGVDLDAVVGYLGTGQANLSVEQGEALLQEMEGVGI